MCLFIDKRKTKKEFENKENRVFYKVYFRKGHKLYTLYKKIEIPHFGTYKANDDLNVDNVMKGMFEEGVYHARTSKDFHRDIAWHRMFNKPAVALVYVKIDVDFNDILAFGINEDVCFKKYHISRDNWKNATVIRTIGTI